MSQRMKMNSMSHIDGKLEILGQIGQREETEMWNVATYQDFKLD